MTTARRLLLGGLLGVLLVAVFAMVVTRYDGTGEDALIHRPRITSAATRPEAAPMAWTRIPALIGLKGAASVLHLALKARAIPEDIVPCYQIVSGGAVTVLRPPRPPTDPLRPLLTSVGIVLPAPLSALDPTERSALVLIAAAASADLPGPEPLRFVGHDFVPRPAEVEQLSRWIRP